MSNNSTDDVLNIIFSACDPEGCGEIPVIRLIDYIDKEMQSCYDRSLLQELKIMLLLTNDQQHIQKEMFDIVIKNWIKYVEDYKQSDSNLETDDSQFDDFLTAHSYTSDMNSVVSSPEGSSIVKRMLEDRITDLEKHNNNLLDENNKLKVLLKDNEETLQFLTLDHTNLQDNYNVLEKKLKELKRMKQDYQELETIQQAQELTIRELESQIECIRKENSNLEKSNSFLQSYVANLKEERTIAVQASDRLRKLLSEEKYNASEMKQRYELAFLKYDAEKDATVEKLKDLENIISDLKNTVGSLKERKMELEDELSKREIETLPMWRFLDESLSDVGETLKLMYSEEECETERNLRFELKASGEICLGHRQLEAEIQDYHEKLEVCSSELVECQKNLNTMSSIILKSTELLKMIQSNTEEEHYAFSDEMEKINDDQCSSACKSLAQDLFTELEKVATRTQSCIKNQLATINEVDDSVCSSESTTDLCIIQEPEALTFYSSPFSYLFVHILKFLFKCAEKTKLYVGWIFKIFLFLFILWILYGVTGKLIYECYRGNGCICYDIGEILSPHIKLTYEQPPPV